MGGAVEKQLLNVRKADFSKVPQQELHPEHDKGNKSKFGVGKVDKNSRRFTIIGRHGPQSYHSVASLSPESER